MKVADGLFVSIDYRLTLGSGEEVDRSAPGAPLGFVAGAGMIIPGLERALQGMAAGERARVTVAPEEAYGPVHPDLFREVPKDRFPAGAELVPGARFQADSPRGPVGITVAAVGAESVTVDLNHPLAGKKLTFDVAVVEVREPRPDEIPARSGGCGCASGDAGPCEPGSCAPGGCAPGSDAGCGCGRG